MNVIRVCLIVLGTTLPSTATERSRHNVTDYLLNPNRYDGHVPPDFNKDYPTNVSVRVSLHDIHSVKEEELELSVDLVLRMRWIDTRLNYTHLGSYKRLELNYNNIAKVWQPDLYFTNEKTGALHSITTPNKMLHIYRNGTVLYGARLSMTLSCPMTLNYYPFDNQKCPMYLQSFGYTHKNINLNWQTPDPFSVNNITMPQFELRSKMIELKDYDSRSTVGTFSTLEVTVILHRKIGYYFIQVFVPSILLVVLSWISFWIDASAVSARVSLGVTCVLTMTTQSSSIRLTLPPVSYVKAIDIWMTVSLMYVFAALLVFAYVNTLLRQQQQQTVNEEVEESKRANKCSWIMKSCTVKFNGDEAKMKAKRADIIARFVFPASFLFFLFVFFLVCGYSHNRDMK